MVKSEMAIEEGLPLRIECTLDAILTDLKYKRVNDKKLRNIFTKTAKKEKMRIFVSLHRAMVRCSESSVVQSNTAQDSIIV